MPILSRTLSDLGMPMGRLGRGLFHQEREIKEFEEKVDLGPWQWDPVDRLEPCDAGKDRRMGVKHEMYNQFGCQCDL